MAPTATTGKRLLKRERNLRGTQPERAASSAPLQDQTPTRSITRPEHKTEPDTRTNATGRSSAAELESACTQARTQRERERESEDKTERQQRGGEGRTHMCRGLEALGEGVCVPQEALAEPAHQGPDTSTIQRQNARTKRNQTGEAAVKGENSHVCRHSQRESVVIKLGFEKVFDLIERYAIMAILRHMGFDDRSLGWMDNLLESRNSRIRKHKLTQVGWFKACI